MAQETIKERVLRVAQSDPFLTIEEIAADVGTTSRYVRTILSEARLSLMDLRKSYARTMEKRLGSSKDVEPVITEENWDPHLKLTKIKNPTIAGLLGQEADHELLQVSQLQRINNIPAFVQLTTYLELTLRLDQGSLRQLLPVSDKGCKIIQKNQWVEVTGQERFLSELLQTKSDQPLLKLCTILYNEREPIAVETMWLPSAGILLRWNEENPLVIPEVVG